MHAWRPHSVSVCASASHAAEAPQIAYPLPRSRVVSGSYPSARAWTR